MEELWDLEKCAATQEDQQPELDAALKHIDSLQRPSYQRCPVQMQSLMNMDGKRVAGDVIPMIAARKMTKV